jgi:triacylglycerol lipase
MSRPDSQIAKQLAYWAAALILSAATALAEDSETVATPRYRIEPDRVYARPENYRLRADMFLPTAKGPHPAVILIHGGGWMGGSKAQMKWHAIRLANHGYVVMSINYRLAPKFKFPAQIEDCRAALRWICEQADQYEVDRHRIGALGYSAGGHLACLMNVTATPGDDRLKAVVAGGAPCDFSIFPPDNMFLAYWLDGSRIERPAQYRQASPVFFASPDDAPTFFYHGAADRLVPSFSAKSLQRRLVDQQVETQMYLCDGKGHVRAFMDHEAFQKSLAFLDRQLELKSVTDKNAANSELLRK